MSRHNKRKMPEDFPFDLLMLSSPSSPSPSPPPKRSRICAAYNNTDYLSPSPPMKSVAKIPEIPLSPPPRSSRAVLFPPLQYPEPTFMNSFPPMFPEAAPVYQMENTFPSESQSPRPSSQVDNSLFSSQPVFESPAPLPQEENIPPQSPMLMPMPTLQDQHQQVFLRKSLQ